MMRTSGVALDDRPASATPIFSRTFPQLDHIADSAILPRLNCRLGIRMVTITPHPSGLLLDVRARPGARRNAVTGVQAGALKVAVTAPAQDGRANKAIEEVLREALGVKRSQLQLVSGLTGRQKKVLVTGLTKTELELRIAPLIAK